MNKGMFFIVNTKKYNILLFPFKKVVTFRGRELIWKKLVITKRVVDA